MIVIASAQARAITKAVSHQPTRTYQTARTRMLGPALSSTIAGTATRSSPTLPSSPRSSQAGLYAAGLSVSQSTGEGRGFTTKLDAASAFRGPLVPTTLAVLQIRGVLRGRSWM